MIRRFLPFCVAGIFLTGCTGGPDTSIRPTAGQGNIVHGYLYHDANHPDGSSQLSSQANYNATHGTWLWPPAVSDKPN
jgi:hypothetical protein